MIKTKSNLKMWLPVAAAVVAARGAQAYELNLGTNMPPVDFHGFVSQGLLSSSSYNYLGDSKGGVDGNFFEGGINASFNPFPRTRIAAQGFMYDMGDVGRYAPFLDYALAEYTFSDYFGIRAGRIRRPAGIYNHIQDVDLARTFVLLPQGIYDSRWRDWSAGLDGADLFGNIPLSKAGSASYEFYGGAVNYSDHGGVATYIENGLPPAPYGSFKGIGTTPVVGGQLWYNTPLDGLRVGASLCLFDGFNYDVTVKPPFGPGLMHTTGDVLMQQYSAEYLWKNWTFQAEYYTYTFTGTEYAPGLGGMKVGSSSDMPQTWYVAASYRFNKYFETGAYYTEFRDFSTVKTSPDGYQHDLALCLRVDPKDWWTFKIEGHYIDGTGLLRDNDTNPVRNSNGWFMLAVKTTLSF
ncbi:MAG TPA: hypothetical protein VK742_21040 [Candidatus Sulfotelmatobacter sp.]|jgi:hypothetical protein|nr:hypothetical protein [Candidatus Sulfotelmatobacter sp.]